LTSRKEDYVKYIFLAVLLGLVASSQAMAASTYDPGASDTTIKIGNTWALSGPVSVTSAGEREMAGYFAMINDQGGVNGRKIDFIAVDDAYQPPKTVEVTRRLVEQDHVLLMFAQLGTPTNLAVRPYLNTKKVPQLFVTTGSTSLVDPQKYPWTMGFQPNYTLESLVFAKSILADHPNAKIGILYQDDDFGRDHVTPFLAALGDAAKTMVVGKASYAVSDPTVTSQIISLASTGANTFVLFAQSRAAAQAISAVRDRAGADALIFIPSAAALSVVGPVDNERLKGVLSTESAKNPSDPAWANDPAVKEYLAWVNKYVAAQDRETALATTQSYVQAQGLVEVLKRAGDNLTRANIMKVATSLHNVVIPLLLPGITLDTSETNYFAIHALQLKRYDGAHWQLVGKPIDG
jgi:ABC-type branched-subunit amino acid transport system substrate-binding protein